MNDNMTNGLVQQWVSVTDHQGRQRLESRWTSFRDLSVADFLPLSAQTAHAA